MDSASDYGLEGYRFESYRVHDKAPIHGAFFMWVMVCFSSVFHF